MHKIKHTSSKTQDSQTAIGISNFRIQLLHRLCLNCSWKRQQHKLQT